jgi:hypothetical protein
MLDLKGKREPVEVVVLQGGTSGRAGSR